MALCAEPSNERNGGRPSGQAPPTVGSGVHGFDPQGAGRIPSAGEARTIGEMLAEARQQSGAQKLSGHDIMALERFDPATRHMIVFDVLTHDSPVGWKGEKMRLFLTDTGYSKALENQEKGHIKIRNHAKVLSGDLHYDHKGRER